LAKKHKEELALSFSSALAGLSPCLLGAQAGRESGGRGALPRRRRLRVMLVSTCNAELAARDCLVVIFRDKIVEEIASKGGRDEEDMTSEGMSVTKESADGVKGDSQVASDESVGEEGSVAEEGKNGEMQVVLQREESPEPCPPSAATEVASAELAMEVDDAREGEEEAREHERLATVLAVEAAIAAAEACAEADGDGVDVSRGEAIEKRNSPPGELAGDKINGFTSPTAFIGIGKKMPPKCLK